MERLDNPTAVDPAIQGWSVLNHPASRENFAQAQKLFEQALRIDPQLTRALLGLARTLAVRVVNEWSDAPREDLARAAEAVTRVLAVLPEEAYAHTVRSLILRQRKDFAAEVSELQFAISLNPSLARAYGELGVLKVLTGRAAEAFAPLETAIRLSPRDAGLPFLVLLDLPCAHASCTGPRGDRMVPALG